MSIAQQARSWINEGMSDADRWMSVIIFSIDHYGDSIEKSLNAIEVVAARCDPADVMGILSSLQLQLAALQQATGSIGGFTLNPIDMYANNKVKQQYEAKAELLERIIDAFSTGLDNNNG